MSTSIQLGDEMQTTCLHCGSVFRITSDQLEMARGQVRCSQCMQVFNALLTLENFSQQQEPLHPVENPATETQHLPNADQSSTTDDATQTVSLNEAMYGDSPASSHGLKKLLWATGIVILLLMVVVQVVYYQRYQLISSSQYQQQILNLCQVLPCDRERFSNLSQIKLEERNVFTHPTHENALMVTGYFTNEADFTQPIPKLLISLFDLQGNLIANRLFHADEYLTDQSLKKLIPGKPAQFRLEILDPGSDALTYEFEFIL